MKTWLTYLAAAAFGLAFATTFKDSAGYISFITFASEIVLRLGAFIVFPLAFFTMSSGTASLSRKPGRTSYVWLTTILWAALTTIVLSIITVVIFRLIPVAFPATSTVPESAEQAAQIESLLASSTLTRMSSANPLSINAFVNFIKSADCLLPIILLALVFGYAVRPTSEIVRPAYITLNSISEVMFRLAKKVARLLWIGIFFISGTWFHQLSTDASKPGSAKFIVLCAMIGVFMLLGFIPFIYALLTGFKRNPYRQIIRLLSAGVASFFSVNYLFSQSTLYTDCRINLGIQKNVVSTALPIHSILTKGGSALVSSLCTCSLVFAINGSLPTTVQMLTIALACTLASFISALHAGYEVLFTTTFALGLLSVDMSGAQLAIIGMLPLLNGMALMLDIMLAGLGTSFTACHLNADCHITAKDNI